MNERTVFTREELCERWGYSSKTTIDTLEKEGLLKRAKHLKGVRYPLKQVRELEEWGVDIPTLTEIRKLREENSKYQKENERLKEVIKQYNKIIIGE